MKALEITATDLSPVINFNPEKGKFQIHGNSLPENARSFYLPVIEWLDKYAESPNPATEIEFKMVLLNTSSTKMFIDVFRKINKLSELGNTEVNIVWYYIYEDEDIYDVGMEFKEFCKAPFKLVVTNDGGEAYYKKS